MDSGGGGGDSGSHESLSPTVSNYDEESPVLHVVVVGFHHKKGCQVEFAHPPLMPGGQSFSPEVPSQWRNLPSLALPDGSHNYSSDTVYFHLPALHDPRLTVFGISCYRQIDADKVKNKTEDITRGTVQKSVCVLSRLPLYGQIQVKMSLITQAYFEEGDFTNTRLIKQTYENLNDCLSDDMLHTQQLYVGLSARDFVLHFRQRSLQLFKLALLERKLLFFKSPVEDLTQCIMTLLSLMPGLLESGLDESACLVPADTPPSTSPDHSVAQDAEHNPDTSDGQGQQEEGDRQRKDSLGSVSSIQSYIPNSESINSLSSKVKDRLSGAMGYILKSPSSEGVAEGTEADSEVADKMEEAQKELPSFAKVSARSLNELGLPLRIFTSGNLCHPYLSLPYIDFLLQPSIRGYIIGATNALFKAKRNLSDVLIDIDEDKLDIADPNLRRAVALTTEDLRFIDYIIKVIGSDEARRDVFLDGVGWEGGDEWVRAQFRFYLVCLLRTSLQEEAAAGPEHDTFNREYMAALRATRHHRVWRCSPPAAVSRLPPGHPFTGQLSITDMRLRLNHTMTNTEGGKRVSAAVHSTGRAVADTGKAVVGGLGAAKGALSAWWGGRNKSKSPSPVDEVAAECGEEPAVSVAET